MIRISRSRQGKGAFDKRKEPPVKKYVAPAQQSSSYGTRKKKKAAALSLAECCTGKKIFNYTRRLHRSGEDRVDLFKGIITAQHWSTRNATCGRVHIGHSLITLITQGAQRRYTSSVLQSRNVVSAESRGPSQGRRENRFNSCGDATLNPSHLHGWYTEET